jgi:hypothetical protein
MGLYTSSNDRMITLLRGTGENYINLNRHSPFPGTDSKPELRNTEKRC